MRHVLIVTLSLLAGTAIAAPVPPLPIDEVGTCILAGVPCVSLVLGNVVVANGQTEQYNHGTYAFQGNVTVEPGGTVEMILSDLSFADPQPVHVHAGGEIIIDSSTLAGSGTPGSPTPVFLLEEGAIVTIVDSEFTSLTVSIASDDAVVEFNTFQLGFPALRLSGFDGELHDITFQNNLEGVNATGGAPAFSDLTFLGDTLGMSLDGVQCTMDIITMEDVFDGILLRNGACVMTSLALNDQSFPPDTGLEVLDGVGASTISASSITDFGTGIFYCEADLSIVDVFFSGNIEDVVSC